MVIGGVAMIVLGTPTTTTDLDICYARDPQNIEALVAFLREVGAKLRGVPEDIPFILDSDTIHRGDTFTFTTSLGDLDVHGTPKGTTGFEDIAANAREYDLGGVNVLVCSLDDLIRMKTAARRPKDELHVHLLRELQRVLPHVDDEIA